MTPNKSAIAAVISVGDHVSERSFCDTYEHGVMAQETNLKITLRANCQTPVVLSPIITVIQNKNSKIKT